MSALVPSTVGGLVVALVLATCALALTRVGVAVGEALYLALAAIILAAHRFAAWRLRKGS